MSKGQTKRLTKQHVSSGGASGIFGEDAKDAHRKKLHLLFDARMSIWQGVNSHE
jgi:hypothetical protein